jgi:hypothetical protein
LTQQTSRYAEEYFYVGKIEVIKNPTHVDYRSLSKEFRRDFPHAPANEQYLRTSYDTDGNKYIWRADFATHEMIDPHINRKFNTTTERGADPLTKVVELPEERRIKMPKKKKEEEVVKEVLKKVVEGEEDYTDLNKSQIAHIERMKELEA